MTPKLYITFILPFCMLLFIKSYAQTPETDSLENLLLQHTLNDTIRVKLLNETAYKLRKININKTFKYAKEAGKISGSLGFTNGKAESLRMTGIGFYENYEYTDALEYFNKSLSIFKQTGNRFKIAKIYTNIANVYYYQNNFSAALEYYQKSLIIYKNIKDKNEISYSYYCLAYAYKGLGNYNKTAAYFNKALQIKEKFGDTNGVAYFLHRIGIVYKEMGDYSRAIDYYQKSLKIKELIGNQRGIASTLSNLGSIYREQGYYGKALEYYQKALKINEKVGDKRIIFNTYNNLGIVYKELGNYGKALYYCQKSLAVIDQIGTKTGIAESYNNIACIYKRLGNRKKAFEYYQKSFTLSTTLNLKDMQAENYKGLANLYLSQNEINKAYANSKKAYDIANKFNNAILLKQSSKILAKSCERLGQYKDACKYFVVFKTMNDSLFNLNTIGKLKSIEYEKEKHALKMEHQKEDALRAQKEQKQKTVRNSFFIGLVLMIIIVTILLRNYYQKRKDNIKLAEQKQKIEDANKKLKQLGKFKTGMTSMIVHDLKTPLNKIVNIDIENPTKQESENVKNTGLQMLNLVMDILDVDKYESAKIELDIKNVLLNELINSAISDVDFLARQKSIVFEQTVNENTEVLADAEIVKRIFVNLLTNAIKFSPYNKAIIIKTESIDNKNAITSITNFGECIPANRIDAVFDKFNQIKAKKSGSVRSTGLGLTFCKLATEAHKGKIWVLSSPSSGTVFSVSLPLSQNNNPLHSNITQKQAATSNKLVLSENEKQLLKPYLDKLKKSTIFAVTDVKNILNKIKQHKINNLTIWAEQIENCIETYNKERYEKLVNGLTDETNSA